MNRQQKEIVVQTLREDFSQSPALYIVDYRGTTVEQLYNLRKRLREINGKMKVAKVRLIKRAIEGMPGTDDLIPLLKDQIALVFSSVESPEIPKAIYDFMKDYQQLSVVAGFLASEVLMPDAVKRIALLPPRDVLLAKLCGTLKAPIGKLATMLHMVSLQLLLVLKQIEEKKKND